MQRQFPSFDNKITMMGRLTSLHRLVAMMVVALCLEPIFALSGHRISSSDDIDEVKKRNLEFELRALEMGMDLDKQATIDKRAFEQKGMVDCAALNIHCDAPKLSERVCKYGYNPKVKNFDEKGCSCVSEYECCGASCPILTEKDWEICENPKKYGIGKYYPVETEDCCDCNTVICLPCMKYVLAKPGEGAVMVNNTHQHFFCENECDEPHEIADPETKCPDYVCRKKPAPAYKEPECDDKCHEVDTRKDKCGYDYEVCKCKKAVHCTPDKPIEIPCLSIEQVFIDVYSCNPMDKNTCMQCYEWKYNLIQAKHTSQQCKKCEMKVKNNVGCHSLGNTCECRVPTNCHPEKPTPPACFNAERVEDPESTMCDHSQGIYECMPCYHWEFNPVHNQVKCLMEHYQSLV